MAREADPAPRTPSSIPYEIFPSKDRTRDARPYIVRRRMGITHVNHAAVAAAHAAAHRALDRHLGWPLGLRRDVSHGLEHPLGAAGVDHDLGAGSGIRDPGSELAFERHGDARAIAARAVFGCQNEPDPARREPVQVEQFRTATGAVEQSGLRSAREQRFAKRRERSEADAAGDHPGLRGRTDELEGTTKPAEARNRVPFDGLEQ